MKDLINNVAEFHRAFGVPVEGSPTMPNKDVQKLRYDLALEELNEFKDACEKGDIIEVFDALVDQLYILFGTAHSFGLSDALYAGFEEVHKSNMSKLTAEGKVLRHPNGKIAKSENFVKPDLNEVLKTIYAS